VSGAGGPEDFVLAFSAVVLLLALRAFRRRPPSGDEF
jgi:hypothetical protein